MNNIDKPAAAILVLCWFAIGQSFEVASIHRNLSQSQNTGINILPGGRISVTNATLKTLIRNAYGILSFQLAGETGWIDSEYYDIEAKTGDAQATIDIVLDIRDVNHLNRIITGIRRVNGVHNVERVQKMTN